MWMLAKLAAFVPGGQIFSILGAIASAFMALVKAVFEGVSVVMGQPIVWPFVLVIGLSCFAGGFLEGRRWNEDKVEAVNARIASMEKQWKSANDRNAADIADALLARQKAEDMARGIEKANRAAAIRAARAADAERLRKPGVAPAPAAPASASGWSLPGFPSLLKAD